jgi:hypothetical protein
MPTDSRDTMAATCYLLDLPSELRNRIYELVLVATKDIETDTWCKRPPARVPVTPDEIQYAMEPALLATCKKIHREGLPIFYGQNVFYGGFVEWDWPAWLKRLTPAKKEMVKIIKLFSSDYSISNVRAMGEPLCANGTLAPKALLEEFLESTRCYLANSDITFSGSGLIFDFMFEGPSRHWECWRVDEHGEWMGAEYDVSTKFPVFPEDSVGFLRWVEYPDEDENEDRHVEDGDQEVREDSQH